MWSLGTPVREHVITFLALLAPNASQIALPRPFVPPVTTQVLFVKPNVWWTKELELELELFIFMFTLRRRWFVAKWVLLSLKYKHETTVSGEAKTIDRGVWDGCFFWRIGVLNWLLIGLLAMWEKCRRRRAGKLFFEIHFLPLFTRNDDVKMMVMTRDTYYLLLCILHTCYTKVTSWERVRYALYPVGRCVIFFSLSKAKPKKCF